MKKCILSLLVLLALVADEVPAIAQAAADDYVLVFSDEFDQKNGSQPDPVKWSRCIRYNAGWNRWISDSKDVVYIKNGQLVCRAIPNKSIPTDTAKMLTGAIETRGKYAFQYGKVEVRMKTSNRIGNFPAVWMKPETGQMEKYGELDIVETYGNLGVAEQTVHAHRSVILGKKDLKHSFRTTTDVTKWHVYGIEWTPEEIIYSIDGEVTGIYRKSTDSTLLAEGQWTFDRPFFLILNQSVGDGNYKCMEPQINRTYETRFDWIRVYQKK